MEMPLFFFYFVLLFLLTFDVIVPGMSRMWHFSNKNVAKLKMHHDLSNCFDKFDLLDLLVLFYIWKWMTSQQPNT